jgi:hypothetical protein
MTKEDIFVGMGVYYRRLDLFGKVESIIGNKCMVKYTWPVDPNAPAEEIDIEQLINKHDAGLF